MVFNTTFNNMSELYHGGQVVETEYPEKTTDPSQVTDMNRIRTHNFSGNMQIA